MASSLDFRLGAKPPFVADSGVVALPGQDLLQRVERLGPDPQGSRKEGAPNGTIMNS